MVTDHEMSLISSTWHRIKIYLNPRN